MLLLLLVLLVRWACDMILRKWKTEKEECGGSTAQRTPLLHILARLPNLCESALTQAIDVMVWFCHNLGCHNRSFSRQRDFESHQRKCRNGSAQQQQQELDAPAERTKRKLT